MTPLQNNTIDYWYSTFPVSLLGVRRGKGRATSVAVGSECLLVVTSRAVLLRYDFTVGSQPGAALLHHPVGFDMPFWIEAKCMSAGMCMHTPGVACTSQFAPRSVRGGALAGAGCACHARLGGPHSDPRPGGHHHRQHPGLVQRAPVRARQVEEAQDADAAEGVAHHRYRVEPHQGH